LRCALPGRHERTKGTDRGLTVGVCRIEISFGHREEEGRHVCGGVSHSLKSSCAFCSQHVPCPACLGPRWLLVSPQTSTISSTFLFLPGSPVRLPPPPGGAGRRGQHRVYGTKNVSSFYLSSSPSHSAVLRQALSMLSIGLS